MEADPPGAIVRTIARRGGGRPQRGDAEHPPARGGDLAGAPGRPRMDPLGPPPAPAPPPGGGAAPAPRAAPHVPLLAPPRARADPADHVALRGRLGVARRGEYQR